MSWCCGSKKIIHGNARFKKPHYCIKSCDSGKVMCISPDLGSQNQVVIWDQNKQDNQRFTLKQKGPDYFLKCKKDKLYLTVDGPQNGARVYGTSKKIGERQRFRAEEVGTNPKTGAKRYVIYTFFGKVLDVCEAKNDNGTKVIQYDYIGKEHQLW